MKCEHGSVLRIDTLSSFFTAQWPAETGPATGKAPIGKNVARIKWIRGATFTWCTTCGQLTLEGETRVVLVPEMTDDANTNHP